MSQDTHHDREGTTAGGVVPSTPDGYRSVEQNVIVRFPLAEGQYREVERILGEEPPLAGYKVSDIYAFVPATAGAAEALCTYLRDEGLPHEYLIRYRWLKSHGPM
jgi:hypothetical protein